MAKENIGGITGEVVEGEQVVTQQQVVRASFYEFTGTTHVGLPKKYLKDDIAGEGTAEGEEGAALPEAKLSIASLTFSFETKAPNGFMLEVSGSANTKLPKNENKAERVTQPYALNKIGEMVEDGEIELTFQQFKYRVVGESAWRTPSEIPTSTTISVQYLEDAARRSPLVVQVANNSTTFFLPRSASSERIQQREKSFAEIFIRSIVNRIFSFPEKEKLKNEDLREAIDYDDFIKQFELTMRFNTTYERHYRDVPREKMSKLKNEVYRLLKNQITIEDVNDPAKVSELTKNFPDIIDQAKQVVVQKIQV